jgi:hypothetical protein
MSRITRTSKGQFASGGSGGAAFVADLRSIRTVIDSLSREDAGRVAEYTFNSSAWKVLKEIRRPESRGGWPILTRTSWKKWGIQRVKLSRGRVVFDIYNNATVGEQRAARGANPLSPNARTKNSDVYAGWVYAKGDGLLRRPIVYGVIKRAIIATKPTIVKNYNERLSRYLSKRRKS